MERDQHIATLNQLLRLCRDSENGFLVAAENVSNRGLKAMLRTCALERAEFATELRAEIRQRGGEPDERGSIIAAVHRGWIDLKAAMTFGPLNTENVVLAESLRGERAALRTYRRALEQPLPAGLKSLIVHQYERIQGASKQIACMVGIEDERLVVRLFDRNEDAVQARDALAQAGFDQDSIEMITIGEMIRVYQPTSRRSTVGETMLAAALLGLVVGSLIGAVVGISMFVIAPMTVGVSAASLTRVLLTALVGAGIGAAILGLFGLLLGIGIAEEDTYLYKDGVQHGQVMMRVLAPQERAFEASRIMQGVNAVTRAGVALA